MTPPDGPKATDGSTDASFRIRFHFSVWCGYSDLAPGGPLESAVVEMEVVMNPDQNETVEQDVTAVLTSEDLIEEVSIDGMCGVY